MDVIHIGLVSSRSWNFIFFDKVRIDVAAGAGSGKVERINQGPGVCLFLDIVPSVAILASCRLALSHFLRKSVDAALISPVRIRVTGRTAAG